MKTITLTLLPVSLRVVQDDRYTWSQLDTMFLIGNIPVMILRTNHIVRERTIEELVSNLLA